MNNICRAFTFFHDKLVVNSSNKELEPKLKKDYLVIGYFDWFSTTTLKLSNYAEESLTRLFYHNSKLNENNSEHQSFQNVFGFLQDDTEDKDKAFWDSDPNKILNFVMFLQFEKYSKNCFDTINDILGSDNTKSYEYIVYHTLDKNDFVVCFKSRLYKDTLIAINRLYAELREKDLNIIYSYTNFTIKYNVISNFELIEALNETIDSICIKTILNNYNIEYTNIPEKIELFLNNLANSIYNSNEVNRKIENKKIVGYEILGDTDCRFIAREVPINKLLHLYSNKELLTRDNPIFKYCFVSSMTSLNIVSLIKKEPVVFDDIEQANKDNKSNSLKVDEIIQTLNNCIDPEFHPIITLLCQINNYILFADNQTSKYELNTLNKPFNTLLNLISNSISDINNRNLDVDDLYDYLTSIYTNIQENIRTDLRFYGFSNFSTMSYYSPTKLRAFYFFVINQISSFYSNMCPSDNDKNYDFILFFTHVQTTYVNQLWKDKLSNDKLMMVKISELDLYNIKDLVFQLAHEAAHFVGNEEIRKREKRFDLIVEYLFYRIYFVLKDMISTFTPTTQSYINQEIQIQTFKKYYEVNRSSICKATEILIESLVKNSCIENKNSFYYMKNVGMYIENLLFDNDFLIRYFKEYIQYIIRSVEVRLLSEGNESIKEMQLIIIELQEFIQKLETTINDYKHLFLHLPGSDYKYIQSLMLESYADLSAVFLFNLKIDDYFDIILIRLKNDKNERVEHYPQNVLFQRACIVSKAISELKDKTTFENSNTFSEFFTKMPKSWDDKNLQTEYDKVIETCKSIESNINHPTHFTYLYVKECLEAQCSLHNKELRNELKEMYNNIGVEDAVEVVKYINEFVSDYGEKYN